MKRWDQRPFEIRNLFNPAFCGLVLSRALHGYEEEDARGMPFSLTLLVLPALYPRLSVPDREQALLRLISQQGIEAANLVLTLAGIELPLSISATLTARRHELADIIATARDTTPEKLAAARLSAARLATLLNSLGLLLAVADAALLLQTVTAAGLHPADPQLDALTLNAALPAVPKGS